MVRCFISDALWAKNRTFRDNCVVFLSLGDQGNVAVCNYRQAEYNQ